MLRSKKSFQKKSAPILLNSTRIYSTLQNGITRFGFGYNSSHRNFRSRDIPFNWIKLAVDMHSSN